MVMAMNLDLCLTFSRLLSYPNAQVKTLAADCYRLLQEADPQAAQDFAPFITFLEQQDLPQIEELFTSAFDLQALSFPYVGYQLCGESQARTLFLMKLQEIYNQQQFSSEGELPDHLSVMLRFIGTVTDPQENPEGLVAPLERASVAMDGDSRRARDGENCPLEGETQALTQQLQLEIISDGLLPALEKIIQGIETADHPYRQLLSALQTYLTNQVETELPATPWQKELSHG